MVLDGNLLVHLPKVGWWIACEGNLAYFIWRLYQVNDRENDSCLSPSWVHTSSALIVVSLLEQWCSLVK